MDVLVNNLGIFGAVPARDVTDDEWHRYFDVNVLSAVRLIRTQLPGMVERGWGRAIQIASDSAIVIPEEMIHDGTTKTALLAVSRGFAKDAAGTWTRSSLRLLASHRGDPGWCGPRLVHDSSGYRWADAMRPPRPPPSTRTES